MTIPQLKSWLTDHDVELPPSNQKKDFYVALMMQTEARKAAQDNRKRYDSPLRVRFTMRDQTLSNPILIHKLPHRSCFSGHLTESNPVTA